MSEQIYFNGLKLLYMSEILIEGDTFSYDVSIPCMALGHSDGSAELAGGEPNNFVFIDDKLIICVGSSHKSNCMMGCSMTVSGTEQDFVFINDSAVCINKSEGDMGSCHPNVTVPENTNQKWVNIDV